MVILWNVPLLIIVKIFEILAYCAHFVEKYMFFIIFL